MQKNLLPGIFSVLLVTVVFAQPRKSATAGKPCRDAAITAKPVNATGIHRPFWSPNRIGTYLSNDGAIADYHVTGRAGMEWPAGSGNTINFASGIRYAGIKQGEIVSAVYEYGSEFQPGTVKGWSPGGAGTPEDRNDSRFRVYMISQRDRTVPMENPDYTSWPVADGAPLGEDGTPFLLGTSTVWTVFNDFNQSYHDNLFASPPIGIEVQMTGWAYDRPNALGDMMFFAFKAINKSGVDIDSAFVAFWADMDIGDGHDMIACDTALSLGYGYDTHVDAQYGANAPAIGYVLLQGPVVPSPGDTATISGRRVPGFKNLPMTAFVKYT